MLLVVRIHGTEENNDANNNQQPHQENTHSIKTQHEHTPDDAFNTNIVPASATTPSLEEKEHLLLQKAQSKYLLPLIFLIYSIYSICGRFV